MVHDVRNQRRNPFLLEYSKSACKVEEQHSHEESGGGTIVTADDGWRARAPDSAITPLNVALQRKRVSSISREAGRRTAYNNIHTKIEIECAPLVENHPYRDQ